MSDTGLISRKELFGGGFRGGDKRRATAALSLIQASAAHAALKRHSVNTPIMTEGAFKERSRAYLSAFAEGAKKSARVSIQELERSAPDWSLLVPENPAIRAELARLIAQQYRFIRRRIPHMAMALGLDDPAVQSAFKASSGQSLATIYQDSLQPTEHLRWVWSELSSRIETLPPFWTAFALTITETVGAGTLALPIAFATVGPLAGVIVLVLIGLINLVTVAYLAEASARNPSIQYGSAFVGRLVQDYLGAPASILLRIALFAFCCIVLASYYTGFASTLGAVTGLPEPFWVTLVCGTGLFLILRKSLLGTLASALIIGVINISILVFLSAVALKHASVENLMHRQIPFIDGQSFEASHLQLVFGIVLVSYFGHLSVSNCAQTVLRRDPDGRSLKWGTIAAMVTAIVIYCLWSVSVGGAVGQLQLQGETGTALVPLAAQVGPQIYVLGGVFVILGLGMSSVHFGLGIFNMSRELIGNMKPPVEQSQLRNHAATLGALIPVLLVFGYVQWTYYNGTPSFTAPLELLGVVLTPVLAGIFPVLLLMASRAQGLSVRGAGVSAAASNPLVLTIVILLSFAGLLFHGLIIWQEPVARAAALFAAAIMLCLIGDLIRRGAFKAVVHIEIRYFPQADHSAMLSTAYAGKAIDLNPSVRDIDINLSSPDNKDERGGSAVSLSPEGLIRNFRDCHSIEFNLPIKATPRVHISALRVSADFEAVPIDGLLGYQHDDNDEHTVKLNGVIGLTRIVIPKTSRRITLHLST